LPPALLAHERDAAVACSVVALLAVIRARSPDVGPRAATCQRRRETVPRCTAAAAVGPDHHGPRRNGTIARSPRIGADGSRGLARSPRRDRIVGRRASVGGTGAGGRIRPRRRLAFRQLIARQVRARSILAIESGLGACGARGRRIGRARKRAASVRLARRAARASSVRLPGCAARVSAGGTARRSAGKSARVGPAVPTARLRAAR
jgi:hypothetical protein